jgi:hypothetical protein
MIGNGGHSGRAADKSGEIPIPSAEDQDMLLDVWREALAQVLADRNIQWDQTLRSIRAESQAAIAELRATIAETRREICDDIERRVSEKMAQIRQPADGAPGPRGEPGPPGRLPSVTTYVAGKVHYVGDVVAFEGATFQARCDTAKSPGGDDWTCLATAGADGKDGSDGHSFRICGTYNEQTGYQALDVVALNGSSFVARKDCPGPCPGNGWQLIASAGRPGRPGPKGERGEKGEPGETPIILAWKIDRQSFTATPIMSDGSEVLALGLRELFEQFQIETS